MKIVIDSFRKYITPLCCIHCECWFFRINFNWLLSMNWQKIGILRARFNLWDEASRMWHSDKVHIFCESHIFEEIFLLVLTVISNVQTNISSTFFWPSQKSSTLFHHCFLTVVIPSIYRPWILLTNCSLIKDSSVGDLMLSVKWPVVYVNCECPCKKSYHGKIFFFKIVV